MHINNKDILYDETFSIFFFYRNYVNLRVIVFLCAKVSIKIKIALFKDKIVKNHSSIDDPLYGIFQSSVMY